MKATTYFEDLIFSIVEDLGGEDSDAVDDNLNLAVMAINQALTGQVDALTKRVKNLEQLIAVMIGQTGPLQ